MNTQARQPGAATPGEPFKIDPDGFYTNGQLRLLLNVSSRALAAARRTGQLRYARKGMVVIYRGAWVIDWLESESKGGKANG